MKRILYCLSVMIFLFAGSPAYAFTSGSTGADGAFNPASNTQLQVPPDGVFNFTTVNVPAGITVSFISNASNTPVYMLASGDVNIAGTIDVSGSNASFVMPGKGGPGGFDGGYGGNTGQGSNGLGPGGGAVSANVGSPTCGSGGGYSSAGGSNGCGAGGATYGNSSIIPMIGGSGGAGGSVFISSNGATYIGVGGGGGGGALLIASSGTINVTGSILVNGGGGAAVAGINSTSGGGGSGGAIKLVAGTISGNGTISAVGGSSSYYNGGGYGRIRLEADSMTRTANTTPAFTVGAPGPVFVANMPSIQITSIAGVAVPADPTGSYGTPDVTLPAGTANPVQVGIAASYIPLGTVISVSVVPESGAASSATSTALSGTLQSSTATASVNLSPTQSCILMAQTTFTIQTAMNYQGEKITKASVVASMGGGSHVTYITESGRRVPAEKLFASLMK